jgi:excisionase family DNA binding protein
MIEISPDHLARGAYVYVRQSTVDQLKHNHESRRRQYALADRARSLGWSDVVVIDDDLGVSASGVARPGFQRLLAAICAGQVGAVVSIEASRLARNGRDWHTLLEFCALVGSLIIDEDGVYDPRSVNDRLLLGMKGTLSEMELSLLRQRSMEALKLKAARGDLHTTVAIGFIRGDGDRVEKDPDLRVQEAIAAVFAKFAQLHSARQVMLWFRQESIALPAAVYGPLGRSVQWKAPIYNTVLKILTNPTYAGAYAFGRTGSKVRIEDGRKRVVRGHTKPRETWQVLIKAHHEGYIDWETYEHNLRVIADNTNMKGGMARGALRQGEALLAGLLRCGHCGRKLHVGYCGSDGNTSRYYCRGATLNHGAPGKCISFGSMRIDRDVAGEVLRVLQPLGVEAALHAIEERASDSHTKRRQIELALEQSRFEAARAHRQFDAVDPGNRLVAGELERRWNERLSTVAQYETELQALDAEREPEMTPELRQRLLSLGADLALAWDHPNATSETRKRILRAVLNEIVVRVTDTQLQLVVHWQGGDHTTLAVVKNRTGQHRWTTDTRVEQLINDLARQMPDGGIASLLNRMGQRTAKGHTWTESRVRSFRGDHRIAVYRDGEREARGEMTLEQAAQLLQVSKMSVLRMISARELPAHQACKGAAWVIRQDDLARVAAQCTRQPGQKRPRTINPNQKTFEFQ